MSSGFTECRQLEAWDSIIQRLKVAFNCFSAAPSECAMLKIISGK